MMHQGATAPALGQAVCVILRILDRYGAKNVWQVEKLDTNFFRARLHDGGVIIAMVMGNGDVEFRQCPDMD